MNILCWIVEMLYFLNLFVNSFANFWNFCQQFGFLIINIKNHAIFCLAVDVIFVLWIKISILLPQFSAITFTRKLLIFPFSWWPRRFYDTTLGTTAAKTGGGPPPPGFWRKKSKEAGKERERSETDSIWFLKVSDQVEVLSLNPQ